MAQNELMLRLIKDEKIVGYVYFSDGHIYWSNEYPLDYPEDYSLISENIIGIPYDSFELGIKHNDEQWFEGDIIKDSRGTVGTIVYSKAEWNVCFKGQGITPDYCVELCEYFNGQGKCIGNIHDNPELTND